MGTGGYPVAVRPRRTVQREAGRQLSCETRYDADLAAVACSTAADSESFSVGRLITTIRHVPLQQQGPRLPDSTPASIPVTL